MFVLGIGWGIAFCIPSLLVAQVTVTPPNNTVRIDKIAACVNDELIMYSDIEKAIHLFSILKEKDETRKQFYLRVLDDLVNYKIISMEYKNDYTLEEADYDEVQTAVIEKLGSLETLNTLLKSYQMEWADFKVFIRERVAYEKVLNKMGKVKIPIKFSDIEAFYNTDYLPSQESLGLKPRTLIEMSTIIENHLRKERTHQDLENWLTDIRASYTVENKLIYESIK